MTASRGAPILKWMFGTTGAALAGLVLSASIVGAQGLGPSLPPPKLSAE